MKSNNDMRETKQTKNSHKLFVNGVVDDYCCGYELFFAVWLGGLCLFRSHKNKVVS